MSIGVLHVKSNLPFTFLPFYSVLPFYRCIVLHLNAVSFVWQTEGRVGQGAGEAPGGVDRGAAALRRGDGQHQGAAGGERGRRGSRSRDSAGTTERDAVGAARKELTDRQDQADSVRRRLEKEKVALENELTKALPGPWVGRSPRPWSWAGRSPTLWP